MKIVVLGGNGRTGRLVVRGALAAGHSVTALVRRESSLTDLDHDRLEVRCGDVCDRSVLAPLLPGHDVVISALGPRWPTRAASAIYPDSAASVVPAMEESGVQRLLVTSSGLLFPAPGVLTRALCWLVPRIVSAVARMEEQIRASSLEWTIARTGFLSDEAAPEFRMAVEAMPEGGGSVSRAGLARFLLEEAERGEHRRRIVGLCG